MKKVEALLLISLLALGASACDDSPFDDEPGSMSLLLTDAPGDFTKAIVTIERIELLGDDEEDEDSADGGRIVLLDEAWTGDLLELSNDVDEIVSDIDVPAGTYSQLRFVISGGCIEVETEEGIEVYASDDYLECGAADGDLQMPSFATSGLKVDLPGGFEISGDHRIMLIDFDVAESFGHQAGNSGRWVMDPVIHASEITVSGNLDITLAVADSVELPRELTADSFQVRIDEEPPITVVDGVASFDFLRPGTYTVDLVSPDSVSVTTDPTLPLELEIESGDDASATITITSAS